MQPPKAPIRWRDLDLDPIHWVQEILRVLGLALSRLWGRDVMLYVGGVSFFALLAVFPGLAILIGLYSLLLDPNTAARQADALAFMMPTGARPIFQSEMQRLAHAPVYTVSLQSLVILVIGVYAAHRGFKALLAGLSFIHDEEDQRGFFGFNLMALFVLIAAFGMLFLMSGVFLTFRLLASTLNLRPLEGVSWIQSEWTWATLGLVIGMTLIYRYAMSRQPVGWRASLTGGVAAGLFCVFMSWASAFYVEKVAHLGATYGSISAVIIFLIWLSWSVNAVFFGGALATEVEIALDERPQALVDGPKAIALKAPSSPES
ncbi:YihY/virulence factor BrkB family protein [Caulobacter sp. 602-2]|uniref:YihY/virulence factor BrkB family protein n=1 Tax=Caulobacter sp. 602-2 TaxID=2710887 RepID=A0A6G4QRZ7_9CAUL|nr:YihY/virulence factor BrkB family protein [Caulobacter sp. 602-2]NGM48207.1 YihY/virulence factor BrkB family protein [Caulobacter sp. 602-2]